MTAAKSTVGLAVPVAERWETDPKAFWASLEMFGSGVSLISLLNCEMRLGTTLGGGSESSGVATDSLTADFKAVTVPVDPAASTAISRLSFFRAVSAAFSRRR